MALLRPIFAALRRRSGCSAGPGPAGRLSRGACVQEFLRSKLIDRVADEQEEDLLDGIRVRLDLVINETDNVF